MNPLAIVNLSSILLVAVGGAVGCTARFLTVRQIVKMNPTIFPAGTMVVNIVGSLLLGWMLAKYGGHSTMRAFFMTGMVGGFTTFSAFSWDALQLLHRGQTMQALLYVIGSVFLSITAVWLGFRLAQ